MTDLYLVRLRIRLRPFTSWALSRRYLQTPTGRGRGRPKTAESGYAMHAALAGLFGEQSPRPFRWVQQPRRSRQQHDQRGLGTANESDLLAYARVPIEHLRALAQVTNTDLPDIVDWGHSASKPMPNFWPPDLRLRFDLRACPVRRLKAPLAIPFGSADINSRVNAGKEVDAFQVAVVRAQERGVELPTREGAYIDWLTQWLDAKGDRPAGAHLLPQTVRVQAYRSVRVLRRSRDTHGFRRSSWLTRPDVHFTGQIDVVETNAFSKLLKGGVGRHCGFGFGMLLLRPA